MTGKLGRGPVGQSVFFRLPDRLGFQELGRVHFQDVRQLPDDLQPHVGHAPLDPAHVGPVHPGLVRQSLLGQLPLVPEPSEVSREELAQVHVQNQPVVGRHLGLAKQRI